MRPPFRRVTACWEGELLNNFASVFAQEFRQRQHRWLPVEGVANSGEVVTVHNLRVADWHTHFVGANEWEFAIWSHNRYRPTTGDKQRFIKWATQQRGYSQTKADWVWRNIVHPSALNLSNTPAKGRQQFLKQVRTIKRTIGTMEAKGWDLEQATLSYAGAVGKAKKHGIDIVFSRQNGGSRQYALVEMKQRMTALKWLKTGGKWTQVERVNLRWYENLNAGAGGYQSGYDWNLSRLDKVMNELATKQASGATLTAEEMRTYTLANQLSTTLFNNPNTTRVISVVMFAAKNPATNRVTGAFQVPNQWLMTRQEAPYHRWLRPL